MVPAPRPMNSRMTKVMVTVGSATIPMTAKLTSVRERIILRLSGIFRAQVDDQGQRTDGTEHSGSVDIFETGIPMVLWVASGGRGKDFVVSMVNDGDTEQRDAKCGGVEPHEIGQGGPRN